MKAPTYNETKTFIENILPQFLDILNLKYTAIVEKSPNGGGFPDMGLMVSITPEWNEFINYGIRNPEATWQDFLVSLIKEKVGDPLESSAVTQMVDNKTKPLHAEIDLLRKKVSQLEKELIEVNAIKNYLEKERHNGKNG